MTNTHSNSLENFTKQISNDNDDCFPCGRSSRTPTIRPWLANNILAMLLCTLTFPIPSPAQKIEDGRMLSMEDPIGSAIVKGGSLCRQEFLTDEKNQHIPFVRIQVLDGYKSPYDVECKFKFRSDAPNGSVVLVQCQIRSHTADTEKESRVTMVVQNGPPEFKKSIFKSYLVRNEWRKISIPVTLVADGISGVSEMSFWLSHAAQTIDISEVRMLLFPIGTDPTQLPTTKPQYGGMEPNSEWRLEAERRIESIRKGGSVIQIKHRDGTPVSHSLFRIQLKKHQFQFGTAVNEWMINGLSEPRRKNPMPNPDPMDVLKYKSAIKTYFSHSVIENGLKYDNFRNPVTANVVSNAIRFLSTNGISVRGHYIMQCNLGKTTGKVDREEYREIRRLENQHDLLTSVQSVTRDKLNAFPFEFSDWDVLNHAARWAVEPMDLTNQVHLMKWIKSIWPDLSLAINENFVLEGGNDDTGSGLRRSLYQHKIESLLKLGAPFEKIGFMGHVDDRLTAIPKVYDLLERFAKYGKKIQVTEYDIVGNDPETHAAYTRDFLTICFSHPAVDSFLLWGFWDGMHWKGDALLYDKNWNLKPTGKAWMDLVHDKWKTDVQVRTDANGEVHFRGFLGAYEVAPVQNYNNSTYHFVLKTNQTHGTILVD